MSERVSERALLLSSLIEAEGIPFGREDSFKMSRGSLLTQRFLLGVRTKDLPTARILRWCEILGMPRNLQTTFAQHLSEANMVGVGLEDGCDDGVYKMYLEFWDKVRQEVRRTGRNDPLLLHLGFKWRAREGSSDGRITRYTCFPRLSLHDTLARIEKIYEGAIASTARDLAMAIVRSAALAAPTPLFLYVETSEAGSSRVSFDINLYRSELRMADIDPLLRGLACHYAIPDEQFVPLFERIGRHLLGHLSGGVDRNGADVTALYFETRALDL